MKSSKQVESNKDKNPKWIGVVLSFAFVSVLAFGSYSLYNYIITPDPWYVKMISKACNMWIW